MDAFVEYLIPVNGLKIGTYSFDFQLDNDFFSHFENSSIQEGNFKVQLVFEKRIDLYELNFSFEGTTKAECDRCLADIKFPVIGKNRLIVKFAEEAFEDADVVYVPLKTEEINVAKYIYEFISLAIPFIKTYDCESEKERPCDEDMLARLEQNESTDNSDSNDNPLWDNLKNIKFK